MNQCDVKQIPYTSTSTKANLEVTLTLFTSKVQRLDYYFVAVIFFH